MKKSLVQHLGFFFMCNLAVILIMSVPAKADSEAAHSVHESLEGLKFGILTYFDYSAGQHPEPNGENKNFNRFLMTRGYFTLKKEIGPWLAARMTTDIHQNAEGDYNVRLKYLYGEIHLPDMGPLTNLSLEAGLSHTTWLDFEQKINPYRAQAKMAIEHSGILFSSDTGVGLMGYFGPELENAAERTGNGSYAGRYGSWHVGGFNGSGYHDVEENQNKIVEGRISLRPIPSVLPGLQFHYHSIYGQGNTENTITGEFPDYEVHLGMASLEHSRFTLTGQYYITEGNASGTFVDTAGNALDTEGFSFYGRLKLPIFNNKPALFARYDYFDVDVSDDLAKNTAHETYTGGVSYDFYKRNMIIIAYETANYENDSGGINNTPVPGNDLGDDQKIQVVLQIKF